MARRRPVPMEGETAHASPLGAAAVGGAVGFVGLPDQHHFAAAVARDLAVLLVAPDGVLLLLEAVQPEDHVVVVIALEEVLAESVGRGQPEDVLPLRVVDGHFHDASAEVDRHVFRSGAAAVAAAGRCRRRGLLLVESDLARADPGPKLPPGAIRRPSAVHNRLLDVEPSLPSGRGLIRAGRLVVGGLGALGGGHHLVPEKGPQFLDAVRRMWSTVNPNKKD